MDEITASLDYENENKINEALNELKKGQDNPNDSPQALYH